MKKHYVIGAMVFSMIMLGFGAGAGIAFAQEDVAKHPSCPYCGMDRAKFAHSRVLVDYEDGSSFGACSLHCAAVDMAVHIDKTPKSIMVGDYDTKKLIDAETATWVIGGNKMGVMTKRAKWAFEGKEGAEKYIKENGGQLAGFEEAMKASYEDMHEDTKMIRERRKEKRMKMMKPAS
jgi:copper chaperone NosL